jgi:heme exporter protein A
LKQGERNSAVRIEALSKRFGLAWALSGIDFTLDQGELLSVFGPNGAGKSTLIRVLSTLMRPTSGKVTLLGYDLGKEAERLRKLIGVLTHHPLLFDNLTAQENLKFYGQMFGVDDLKAKIEKLLTEVGLIEQKNQLVGTFSRGMQQRLAIARVLIHEPRILLLDEPHTGLDQDGMALLTRTLKAFLEQGRTVMMTSHDFARGLELCSKAAILNNGHLIYWGDPSKLEDGFESFYKRSVT